MTLSSYRSHFPNANNRLRRKPELAQDRKHLSHSCKSFQNKPRIVSIGKQRKTSLTPPNQDIEVNFNIASSPHRHLKTERHRRVPQDEVEIRSIHRRHLTPTNLGRRQRPTPRRSHTSPRLQEGALNVPIHLPLGPHRQDPDKLNLSRPARPAVSVRRMIDLANLAGISLACYSPEIISRIRLITITSGPTTLLRLNVSRHPNTLLKGRKISRNSSTPA